MGVGACGGIRFLNDFLPLVGRLLVVVLDHKNIKEVEED